MKFMRYLKKHIQSNFFVFIVLFTFGAIIYSNVIHGSFIFDDNLLIEHNRLIRSLDNIPHFFISSSETGAGLESNFYRPLQNLVYAIIYFFFQLSPEPYHIVSIFIHLTNTCLVFILLKKIMKFTRVGSMIGALLFLVHPVQAEAVSYISGIADPLCFMFMIIGILLFYKSVKNIQKLTNFHWTKFLNQYFLLSLVCLVLGLLSKEMGVVFFPLTALMTLYFWNTYDKNEKKISIYSLLVYLAIIILYLILKFTIFNFTGAGGLSSEDNVYTQNVLVRLLSFLNIIWDYLLLIIAPWELYLEKPFTVVESFFHIKVILGFIILSTLIFLAYKSYRNSKKVFFGLSWVLICLVPISGIIPLNAIYLEHWLYFPLIGISILLAQSYDYIDEGIEKKILVIFITVFLVLLSVRTVIRNKDWTDPIRFYQNEIKYNPNSARVYNNLAMHYSDIEWYNLAAKNYQKAIELQDTYPQTHHNLARVYVMTGQYEKAIGEYYSALSINPNFIYSHVDLYNFYKQLGYIKQADYFKNFIQRIQNGEEIKYDEIQKVKSEKTINNNTVL
ncbi:hypothetical protein GF362_05945 [Candidatus Dojkabacteria bacterium]|nr:hypothetical protein [Candidatus Dojkabacteria bacterium]